MDGRLCTWLHTGALLHEARFNETLDVFRGQAVLIRRAVSLSSPGRTFMCGWTRRPSVMRRITTAMRFTVAAPVISPGPRNGPLPAASAARR